VAGLMSIPPGWWTLGRHAYDTVVSAVAGLGSGPVLRAAGAAGRMSHRLHAGNPAPDELRRLFGSRPIDAVATARRISELRYRNRAMAAIVAKRSLSSVIDLADEESVEQLQQLHRAGPAVLLTWHIGPVLGLATLLARGAIPALIVRTGFFYTGPPCLEFAYTAGGARDRVAVLLRAINRLRDGGLVVLAADGPDPAETMTVRCFGRRVALARGPFAMSRMAAAAIVPLAPYLNTSGKIALRVGSSLPGEAASGERPVDVEQVAADAAASWFESYVSEAPHELWVYTLRRLLAAREW